MTTAFSSRGSEIKKGDRLLCQFLERYGSDEEDDVITESAVVMDSRTDGDIIYIGCRVSSVVFERYVICKKARRKNMLDSEDGS